MKPANVSSSGCTNCHDIDEIGIITTTGIPITQEFEWQKQLHRSLADPDCLACHNVDSNALELFQHQLLQSSVRNKCALCHIDIKPEDTIHSTAGDFCGNCHSDQTWSGAVFDHDAFFRFDSNHPAVCSNCHLVENDYSQYTCYTGCHSEAAIRGAHLGEDITDYQDCAECHSSGHAD